jgi:hypothetical protein
MAFTVRHPINKKKDFLVQKTGNVFGSVTNHHAVVINEKIVSFGTYYSKVTAWDGTLAEADS